MSYNYSNFGTLLSNTGTQSLGAYRNTSVAYKYSSNGQASYMSILSGISGGFDMQSIFGNSSGIGVNYSGISDYCYGGNTGLGTSMSGLSRSAAISSMFPYGNNGFGSSVVDDFYGSIRSVALGQEAPTSVFEQRLGIQSPQGSMLGDYSNFFSTDSGTSSTRTNTSNPTAANYSYNVFGSSGNTNTSANKGFGTTASSAHTVSELMSSLNITG